MAIFGYGRVSTRDQNSENQRQEIEAAGYKLEYWHADIGVSGKTPACQRPQFQKLLDRIREDETLVVSKLDRLGRDAIDILQTLRMLEERKIKVFILQLGQVDMTSPLGKAFSIFLSAFAQMERDFLVERTHAGLNRAKAEGKKLGRKPKTNEKQRIEIKERFSKGESISSLSRLFNVSRASIQNIIEDGQLVDIR